MQESIQPIVLVGGRSSRFGRDKLRERLPGSANVWLVDRPIAALREVFGARVAVVGECHPDVRTRGDLVIEDQYPGVGPAGGILAALEATTGDVFVLSGDLPAITPQVVRRVMHAASEGTVAWAVLAVSPGRDGLRSGLEPCIGVYRRACARLLRSSIAGGRRSLYDMVPQHHLATVAIDGQAAVNLNTTDALDEWMARGVSADRPV